MVAGGIDAAFTKIVSLLVNDNPVFLACSIVILNKLGRAVPPDFAVFDLNSETVNAIGSVNSNTAVSFQDGTVQTVTVAGNCEFSFSNPPASGKAGTVTLIVTNGGAHTTTFASAVKWPSDVAPSLTTSGVDVISFLTTDGGSNIYGFVGGLNFS